MERINLGKETLRPIQEIVVSIALTPRQQMAQ